MEEDSQTKYLALKGFYAELGSPHALLDKNITRLMDRGKSREEAISILYENHRREIQKSLEKRRIEDQIVATAVEPKIVKKTNHWKTAAIVFGVTMLVLMGVAYGYYGAYNQAVHDADISRWLADYWRDEAELARFDFYYVLPIEQYFGVDALEDDINYGGDWIDPYAVDVFDCSEMSAYLEWELENLGWHTIIVAGDSPFGSGYHAWLLVEAEPDAYMPVEATIPSIVWWDSPYFDNYFDYDYEFETIMDALEVFQTEFDWWE